jgi:DNA modification methylase
VAKLYHGDCLKIMKDFPDECIDLTVTSPPYDNLRVYKGYTFEFEPIAQELYRVTKQGGVVVWVVGDGTSNGSETGTSFRQALYFKDICGFNIHDTMIYEKSGVNYPSTDKYYQSWEFMFVLSKGTPRSINLIKDRKNIWAGQKIHSTQREPDGSLKPKSGTGRITKEYGVRFNIWRIPHNLPGRAEHPATFPEALARDHILSWSNIGDTVMDCFLGSGTTGRMAVKYQRDFIGIEIAEEYFKIAERNINQAKQQLAMPIFER